jgi:flagellin
MIINHNMSAIFAQRQLWQNENRMNKVMEKLASGYRINRASDDASGLAVSEKLRSQIRGLEQAGRNTQNAISFIQVTEGYLQESEDIVHRIRELAVQASNGIYSNEDRLMIQVEVSQLIDEVDRIASHAQFNGMNMLTGRFSQSIGANIVTASMWFHLGANMDQREKAYIGTMTSESLGLRYVGTQDILSISSANSANMTIGRLDSALLKINKQRADLGAYQNRLEHAAIGLAVGAENMQAAESRIRDSNMANEMVFFTRDTIMLQAATAILAQANAKTQSVLQLLG